jgi:hypothetical protein
MRYSERLPVCPIRQTESPGALVLVITGAVSGALAVALGIRFGMAGALSAIIAGAVGICLAGLWQGLARIPWATKAPKYF